MKKLLTKLTSNTGSVNCTKKVKTLERPWASMPLIYTLPEFLDGLKSRMLTNYDRTLKMTQSLNGEFRLSFCVYVCFNCFVIQPTS